MGAFVTQQLELINQMPENLIVSGSTGPGGLGDKKERHKMEGDEFITEIKEIGGVPDEFFEHEGLLEYFTPILKSDFKILELERERPLAPLRTPIIALMGTEEKHVEHINNWKNYTISDFYAETLSGNHFYIHNHVNRIVEIINSCFEGKAIK